MEKTDFLTILKESGLDAESRSGIPIVYVDDAQQISATHNVIKKLIQTSNYRQSYGISVKTKKGVS